MPITVEVIVIGILHRIAPDLVQFLFGLTACLFLWLARSTSPAHAVKAIGWVLFPIRDKVYVVVKDEKPKSRKVEPTERDKVVNDPRTDPKPSEPTPEELKEWAAFDAKNLKGPSIKMKDLYPDEEPF